MVGFGFNWNCRPRRKADVVILVYAEEPQIKVMNTLPIGQGSEKEIRKKDLGT